VDPDRWTTRRATVDDARRFYERHGFSATEEGSTERSLYHFQELAR
jgi:hypothetical protein